MQSRTISKTLNWIWKPVVLTKVGYE